MLERSRTRLIVCANGTREVGEEVEGAGCENTPCRACKVASALARAGRIGNRFDIREEGFGATREFLLRERARVRRPGRDEGVAERPERSEHRVDVLVAEDRRDDDERARWEARQQVAEPGEVVGAVPDLLRVDPAALEPAREPDALGGAGLDRPFEELLGRGAREREVRLPRSEHEGRAVRAGERLPLRLA